MNRALFLLAIVIVGIGCARVRVEAPKEPIKMDISMRLDIYQHVVKDIDAIEDIVSGSSSPSKSAGTSSSLWQEFLGVAYAQEALSPEVEQAAFRRRDRRAELIALETKGVLGENHLGLVVIRKQEMADSAVTQLVAAENSDRMIIYSSIAEKNKITLGEAQKLYAQKLQESAPAGTPIEVQLDQWQIK
ncbi:MAG: DUF1318 domain-containing protein [Candidatus Omnitrophica bacterium]|nr:DUF1318 domain-containing protein [Candidatus Omnitrophota bacterium]